MSPVMMTLKLTERQLPGYVYLKFFSCENGNIQLLVEQACIANWFITICSINGSLLSVISNEIFIIILEAFVNFTHCLLRRKGHAIAMFCYSGMQCKGIDRW